MEEIKIDTILGSLPDEQKQEVDRYIETSINQAVESKTKELKKELSTKYQINFFEEDLEKAYAGDKYIPKGLFEEKLNEFEKEKNLYNAQLQLISKGLRVDRLDLVKPHLTGDVEKDWENISKNYPELLKQEIKKAKVFPEDDENPANLTEFEKYIKDNLKRR